mgnify:CR=1 FL=1
MEATLKFRYDREADILYIDRCSPYAEQDSEELGDEIVARLNPDTGEVENLEILFFSTRLLRKEVFELPVAAELRVLAKEAT